MEYLYHYTSLETLALILKNKTICFNNLLYVDDVEEAQTVDMGKFGRLVYVSCWTDDEEESIPLWNLYTPNMHGVRIRLPKFPFQKYFFKAGEYFVTGDIESFIDIKSMYEEDKISIAPSEPHLVQIQYTDDLTKLYPKVKTVSSPDVVKKYLGINDLSELDGTEDISYSFKELGKYKRSNWSFQKEWRYIITSVPMGLQEQNPPDLKKQQEYIKRLESIDENPPVDRLFLNIDTKALEELEVVFGPRMSDAEKILAKALLEKYCPLCVYRDSNLQVK